MKQITQTYNLVREYKTKITYAFITVSVVLAFFYAVNIYKLISSTVSLQKINSQMSALSSSIDRLDGQYIELSSVIMPDRIETYGMSRGRVSEYIPRSVSIGRVAMTGHEL